MEPLTSGFPLDRAGRSRLPTDLPADLLGPSGLVLARPSVRPRCGRGGGGSSRPVPGDRAVDPDAANQATGPHRLDYVSSLRSSYRRVPAAEMGYRTHMEPIRVGLVADPGAPTGI